MIDETHSLQVVMQIAAKLQNQYGTASLPIKDALAIAAQIWQCAILEDGLFDWYDDDDADTPPAALRHLKHLKK